MFLQEFGIAEPGRLRVIRLSYDLLGLHSFLTAAKTSAARGRSGAARRRWKRRARFTPIWPTALSAPRCLPTTTLIALGSEAAVKSAGKFKLEGKEYIVQDGDILHIRFSQ